MFHLIGQFTGCLSMHMVPASFPSFLGMFVPFRLFNRQTKCNRMRWIYRNLRLSPGIPVPGVQRGFARITALGTMFVIWLCYTVWLFITYFGAPMAILIDAYSLWAAWFVYLPIRLLRIPNAGYGFRYGIPAGIIGWVLIATPSRMGVFPVIWLHPFEFPLGSLAALVVFVGVALLLALAPETRSAVAPE